MSFSHDAIHELSEAGVRSETCYTYLLYLSFNVLRLWSCGLVQS
jgi:hypothetical protein